MPESSLTWKYLEMFVLSHNIFGVAHLTQKSESSFISKIISPEPHRKTDVNIYDTSPYLRSVCIET